MTSKPVLFVPLVTPLRPDGEVDAATLGRLAHHVMSEGAAAVVLFGTLGEGQSFSLDERRNALEGLLKAGCAPGRIVVGTGAAAIADVVELSRHAIAQGCTQQLLLPPFFFKGISDSGLYGFIAAAIEGAKDPALRLTLYDIPSVVSVDIRQSVIARLVAAYGPIIAGIKDSVQSWEHVEASIRTFPQLDVFVGNEIFLPQAIELGAAGAISGLGNIAPRQMAAVARSGISADDPTFRQMSELYQRIAAHPVVPAVKALAARALGEPGMAAVRVPLQTFDLATGPELIEAADALVNAPGMAR